MLKLYFLHTICHTSDMFRCILIIFRELLNISKAYIMFSNSLKIVKIDRKMSELWQIVSKKYNFNISVFVGFIVWKNSNVRMVKDSTRLNCLFLNY
jgi:hypothetical protein